MPESSLTLKKSDFYAEVAMQFGFPRVEDDMTETQLFAVRSCVNQGTSDFYDAHKWSFLRPYVTLTLPSGSRTVRMPDDFGGFDGSVVLADSDSNGYMPIEFQNPTYLEGMFARWPDATGCPQFVACKQIKGTTGQHSDRQEMLVYPEADAEYSLKFQYYIRPECLRDSHPYAYGGPEHSQTILAACLAAKEQKFDKVLDGPDYVRFQRRLAISIEQDNRKKPRLLGMNRDTSDGEAGNWRQFDPVTINGVVFD